MLLYEIADVHWLMLTDVKHIKKSVLCAQGSFVRSLMSPMSKQRILAYTLYIYIYITRPRLSVLFSALKIQILF